jgi:hypothetical protein
VDVIIIAARLECVGVRLEFLAGGIALALQRLAGGRVEAEQRGDVSIDFGDDRVSPVKIAGLAGPIVGNADVVGDLGRPPPRVDPLDQRRAGTGIEEAPGDEQVELWIRDLLDAGGSGETLRRCFPIRGRRLRSLASFHAAGWPL